MIKQRSIDGKKGKYLPIQYTINDELDQFGNQGPITSSQTKEEREAKSAKAYLGNVKVVWTNGDNVAAAPRDGQQAPAQSLTPQQMIYLSNAVRDFVKEYGNRRL